MRRLLPLFLTVWSAYGAPTGANSNTTAAGANVPADVSVAVPKPADASKPFGMARQEGWTSSRFVGSPDSPAPYRAVRAFEKLAFVNPVEMVAVPGTDRLLIAELAGKIVTFPNRDDVDRVEPAADLKTRVPNLAAVYGFTFHPRCRENGYCYIAYVIGSGVADGSRVSRFRVKSFDPFVIDPDSEQVLITWLSGGHNGASIQFGPEGYLYISTGDGAGPFPPDGLDAGQDVSNLLSAILRIDVDHPQGGRLYRIPEDNPFVALRGARSEIWAYGFRNPWKMSFDAQRGDLWVGDVGWELWEMVYRVEKGGNYGWSVTEGPQTVRQEVKRGPTPILPPTVAISHVDARSVTGGYVYHGSRIPALQGTYVYGDFVTGKIWGLRYDGMRVVANEQLVDTAIPIVCFGVDQSGELYIVGYGEQGMLYRLEPNTDRGANRDFPTLLSRSGLFASVTEHVPAAGVIGYSINAQPWADHATAERLIGIPEAAETRDEEVKESAPSPAIDNSQPVWVYPNNTVLVKTLSLELERGNPHSKRRIETQILHFDQDEWRAYSYRWNDEQTDANLVDASGADCALTIGDVDAPGGRRQHTWRFASRTECLLCHNAYNNGSVLGFTPQQLDRAHHYADGVDNQLRTLSHIGLFKQPVAEGGAALVNPYDLRADLNARFRAYLHVNCGHCHRSGGGGTAHIHVQHDVRLAETHLLGMRPIQGTFAMHRGEVVAAGDPYRSVLYYRMAKLGPGRMPYFGSSVVDRRGLELVREWIAQARPLSAAAAGNAAAGGPDQLPVTFSPDDDVVSSQRARQHQLIAALCAAKESDAASIRAGLDELLANTSGALMLADSVDTAQLSPRVRETVVAVAAAHTDPRVRDLFERFIPDEQRARRLGASIRAADLLARSGDAVRGRKIFFELAGVACKNCHRVGSDGKALGPDLTEIGKKLSRGQILESILEPSKTIDSKYQMWLVETSQGHVHTGILVERTDRVVTLRNAEGAEIRVATKDVEQFAAQPKSLMPELQLRDMTADQVADLLEYLASLK